MSAAIYPYIPHILFVILIASFLWVPVMEANGVSHSSKLKQRAIWWLGLLTTVLAVWPVILAAMILFWDWIDDIRWR
jgi:hypothetical protein